MMAFFSSSSSSTRPGFLLSSGTDRGKVRTQSRSRKGSTSAGFNCGKALPAIASFAVKGRLRLTSYFCENVTFSLQTALLKTEMLKDELLSISVHKFNCFPYKSPLLLYWPISRRSRVETDFGSKHLRMNSRMTLFPEPGTPTRKMAFRKFLTGDQW